MAAIRRGDRNPVLAVLAVFVLMALFISPAYAEDYAVAQTYWHGFNNGIDVYSGVFALNRDFSLNTSSYVKYTVDLINPSFGEGGGGGGDSLAKGKVAAVSGASSAVTAGGSGSKDTRHDITAGITHNFDNIMGVEAYYDFSSEKDYTSRTPTVTLKKDLFDKNTTFTAGYSRNMDSISGQFIGGTRTRNTNNYFVGVTQVLSPVTVAQLGYSRNESKGYESEGIRLVPLNSTAASACTAKSAACVDEAFPSKRSRNAYLFGINHYFKDGPTAVFDRSSFKLTMRYYKDNWDIKSYMAEVEYYKYLTEQTVLRLDYRFYDQTKAYFVKNTYTGAEEFKSASKQLEKFNSHLAGVKLTHNFRNDDNYPGFRLAAVEGKYEYYTESIKVAAHVLMAGLRFNF